MKRARLKFKPQRLTFTGTLADKGQKPIARQPLLRRLTGTPLTAHDQPRIGNDHEIDQPIRRALSLNEAHPPAASR